MMRQEDEAPSDFQDYTLVAITAVAAHLVKVALGDDYGLKRLGERYGHDLSSLDQVGAVGGVVVVPPCVSYCTSVAE